MKALLGVLFVLVMVGISASVVYADSIHSQISNGVNDIHCDKPNHILVERYNGELLCVTERTAGIMNWKIFSQTIKDHREHKEILLDKIKETKQDIDKLTNTSNTIRDKMNSLPIDQYQEEEFDRLHITLKDTRQKISNTKTELINYKTQFHQVTITIYNLENPDKEPRLPINPQATDKNFVTYYLSKEIAIQRAYDFVQTAKHYYISEADGGDCEIRITEPDRVMKIVKGGVPYYKIDVGTCMHSIGAVINGDLSVYVIMDGINGEDIYTTGGFYHSIYS